MNTKLIATMVSASLREDVGAGDITAALLPVSAMAQAHIKVNEFAVICGIAWVDEVFRQIDSNTILHWHFADGDRIQAGEIVVEISGLTRSLVTAERSALNWLQTLSGTATTVAHYVTQLQDTACRLLDTRKTIPGLRYAQKYAVRVGGGNNHRMGLYDAYLIKENHIMSCGSITAAIRRARELHPDKKIEVEVENMIELQEAINRRADIIMLDNFNLMQIREAVAINRGQSKLEVSGNMNLNNVRQIAQTGVDFISVGALTKHIHAIDFSMRI